MTTVKEDEFGISFTYSKNDEFETLIKEDSVLQCQIVPKGKSCFGMIIITKNTELEDQSFREFIDAYVQNLTNNVPDPNIVVKNISVSFSKFKGFDSANIGYSMVRFFNYIH